jgi:hypothetical protein
LAVAIATLAFFFVHAPAIVISDLQVALTVFLIIYGAGLLLSVLFCGGEVWCQGFAYDRRISRVRPVRQANGYARGNPEPRQDLDGAP